MLNWLDVAGIGPPIELDVRPSQLLLSSSGDLAVLGTRARSSSGSAAETFSAPGAQWTGWVNGSWGFGVWLYGLALRKDMGDRLSESLAEIDCLAKREDAVEWMRMELAGVWPDEAAERIGAVAEIIAGTVGESTDQRLSLAEVLLLLVVGEWSRGGGL